MAYKDDIINEVELTDRQIVTIRRLALNELNMVERMMVERIHQRGIQKTQWWSDRTNQVKSLREILDAIAFVPEQTGTDATG